MSRPASYASYRAKLNARLGQAGFIELFGGTTDPSRPCGD